MLFNLCLAILAAVPLSIAAPAPHATDRDTLAFLKIAAVLESLDTKFYKEVQAKFQPADYTGAGFTSANIPITELATVGSEEAAHAQILKEITAAFGETPLACQYDVSALVADVKTAVKVARVIEFVGTAAFAGAAHTIKDKSVLTTAVSIGENEAQHEAIANLLNIANPAPGAFIPAILPQEALAIAGPHISDCDLGVTPNPSLELLNSGPIKTGTKLEFKSPAISGSTSSYYCQLFVGGLAPATVLPLDNCILPANVNGGLFAFVTKDSTALSGNPADRETITGIIGPTVFFVDPTPDPIGQLIRTAN